MKLGDRASGAELLQEEVKPGAPSGERWKSVQQLSARIGEIDIVLEAARLMGRGSGHLVMRLR